MYPHRIWMTFLKSEKIFPQEFQEGEDELQQQRCPAAINSGMWLNMVNVKTPYLADLELESMKKFILDYKRYSQKCPQQLLRRMQQFILEEQLEVICDEEGIACVG